MNKAPKKNIKKKKSIINTNQHYLCKKTYFISVCVKKHKLMINKIQLKFSNLFLFTNQNEELVRARTKKKREREGESKKKRFQFFLSINTANKMNYNFVLNFNQKFANQL